MLSLFSSNETRYLLRGVVLSWILGWHLSVQVQPHCDMIAQLQTEPVTFNQPGFEKGDYYPRNSNCRWVFKSPPGYLIQLTCSLSMPKSEDCREDRFVVHLMGAKDTDSGERFCGSESVDLKSYKNQISIGLVSMKNSKGGQFRCVVKPYAALAHPLRPKNCKCGEGQRRRIIDGVTTTAKKYPFYAFLYDVGNHNRCGAAIIHKRFALTAAHCFRFRAPPEGYSLQVGENTPKVLLLDQVIYGVMRYIIHPKFHLNEMENDLALVQTKKRILFNEFVGTVCLPVPYMFTDFQQTNVTIIGFGTKDNANTLPKLLQETEVTVTGRIYCQNRNAMPIRKGHICTIGEQGKGGLYKAHCLGDSGGPVVWYDNVNTFRYYLLGIMSSGASTGCGSFIPDVNIRVTEYVKWITAKVNDTQLCL